jgi:hypothetical protein
LTEFAASVGKAPTLERGIVDSIFTGKAMSKSHLLRDCTRILLQQHFLNLNEVRLYAKLSFGIVSGHENQLY